MITHNRVKIWKAEDDRRLRLLWDAGWSTMSIGADIGRTKNSICGRARRLNLAMRGSPIPVRFAASRNRATAVNSKPGGWQRLMLF